MKQALVFLVLLAAGLGVLVLVLGVDDLFLDYNRPEITPNAGTRVGPADRAVTGLIAPLPPSVQGPILKPYRLQKADGTVERVRRGWGRFPSLEEFDEGILSLDPELHFYRQDGSETVRVLAGLGTAYRARG